MIGSMFSLLLPPGDSSLGDQLFYQDRIEVPVFPWPDERSRCVRMTAQMYNTLEDYEHLAEALARRLE